MRTRSSRVITFGFIPNSSGIEFYLRRDSILEDTLSNFDALAPTELNYELKLNIEFIGEAGVDQGTYSKLPSLMIFHDYLDSLF